MYVTKHAREKMRVINKIVPAGDVLSLQDAIVAKVQDLDSFKVTVPMSKPVLDQFHGHWEYRRNLRAVVEDRSLVTVYFVA